MRRLILLTPAVLALQGCLFVFIPPGVTGAISDSLTGAQGQNCVAEGTKVADVLTAPPGVTPRHWRVESLSGSTSRCSDPKLPIRAKLVPVE